VRGRSEERRLGGGLSSAITNNASSVRCLSPRAPRSGDIRAGRLTAVMGPSGAGKSSFLHVIGGRLRAVGRESKVTINGSVLINGERRSDWTRSEATG